MIHKSGEDYLEAILILQKKNGYVRSLDVAHQMDVTKPSVSNAVRLLKEGGFLTMDENRMISLTEPGRDVAERMYERHCFLTDVLTAIGVSQEQAAIDACEIEHDISDVSFEKLKAYVKAHREAK